MEALVNYFSNMPTTHRTAFLVGGLATFWMIESAVPLFRWKYNKWKHALLNMFFVATTAIINLGLAFILVMAADWVVAEKIGLLQMIEMPLWVQVIAGLLLMDLIGAWLVHWVEHRVPWMWRFHMVHHSDHNVDTTTANRHHPGESVFRFLFTTLAVIVIGAPMWLVFLYQTMSVVLTQFNHANLNMPDWLDNALVWVLVTPNMHRVHHHYRLPYTDTNYGNIFSVWDRLFGTFAVADNSKLKYGLDTYMEKEASDHLWTILKLPFMKYRKTPEYDEEEVL